MTDVVEAKPYTLYFAILLSCTCITKPLKTNLEVFIFDVKPRIAAEESLQLLEVGVLQQKLKCSCVCTYIHVCLCVRV